MKVEPQNCPDSDANGWSSCNNSNHQCTGEKCSTTVIIILCHRIIVLLISPIILEMLTYTATTDSYLCGWNPVYTIFIYIKIR